MTDNAAKYTPLMNAIGEQDFEKVKELLRNGADVLERDSSGYTPLLFSAYCVGALEYTDKMDEAKNARRIMLLIDDAVDAANLTKFSFIFAAR